MVKEVNDIDKKIKVVFVKLLTLLKIMNFTMHANAYLFIIIIFF